MSDDDTTDDSPVSEAPPDSRAGKDADSLASMLRSAMATEQRVDVLSGVQQQLRLRSGGKFYGDGWSTSKSPPISRYLITSLLMLAVVVVIYAVLTPLAGEPEKIDATPKPVRVLPPTKP